MLEKCRETVEEAGVESIADLTDKEAVAVRDGMAHSISKPTKKARTSEASNVKEDTPEQKELRTALRLKANRRET